MKRAMLVLVLLLVAALAAPPLHAASDPATVIRTTVDQAFEVLRDPALRKPENRGQRLAKLRAIADRVFDWEEMAQSSLGVTYRKITDEERKRFLALFRDLIAEEYMDDLDRFVGDEKVLIAGVEQRDEQRLVKTVLVTHSRDRVPIDYLMHAEGDQWLVNDFSVEGVSLVNHYRKSFSRYLANHTFEELLERLAARAKPK